MKDATMGWAAAGTAAGAPVWWRIALVCVPALVLIVFGLWMVWGGRVAPVRRDGGGRGLARWRDGMTEASRLSFGLAAMGLAYHGVSYACPDHWLPFRVPPERWYLVGAWVVVMVGGSLLVDRRLNARD